MGAGWNFASRARPPAKSGGGELSLPAKVTLAPAMASSALACALPSRRRDLLAARGRHLPADESSAQEARAPKLDCRQLWPSACARHLTRPYSSRSPSWPPDPRRPLANYIEPKGALTGQSAGWPAGRLAPSARPATRGAPAELGAGGLFTRDHVLSASDFGPLQRASLGLPPPPPPHPFPLSPHSNANSRRLVVWPELNWIT